MRAYIVCLLFVISIGACKDVKDSDVFNNLTLNPESISADGQSPIQVSLDIKDVASADRRNFVFSTTSGKFSVSGTSKYTTKAEYEEGVLKAKAVLLAPSSPGSFTVTAQPEFDSPVRDFTLHKVGQADKSVAEIIKLETSSLGIAANFGSEVLITGVVKNKNDRNASKGVSIVFEDLLNGQSAGGRFRNLKTVTEDSSKVSAYYAAPNLLLGTTIDIYCTILDDNKIKTTYSDKVSITVNK
jgi:hypothetical protein